MRMKLQYIFLRNNFSRALPYCRGGSLVYRIVNPLMPGFNKKVTHI